MNGYILRTGGGIPERCFGFFGTGGEAPETEISDEGETYTSKEGSDLATGKRTARKMQKACEMTSNTCRFDFVTVTPGSTRDNELYKLYIQMFVDIKNGSHLLYR